MNTFTIAGDNNRIDLTIKEYEQQNSSQISDLNWLKAFLNADIGSFKSSYSLSLSTNELKYINEEITNFLIGKTNKIDYEAEESGIGITIIKNNLGNIIIKGFLKNIDLVRTILNFEFESNISYLTKTKEQLDVITKQFKVKN